MLKLSTVSTGDRRGRRWNRRKTITLSDVAVWTFVTLITAVSLLALCIVMTLVWPTP